MINIIVWIWTLSFWACLVIEREDISTELDNLVEKLGGFSTQAFICVIGGFIIAYACAPFCFVLDIIDRIKH